MQMSNKTSEAPVPTRSIYSSVRFEVEPVDAIVYLDGAVLGAGPVIEKADLPAGTVAVRVESEGFTPQEFLMTMKEATDYTRSISLKEVVIEPTEVDKAPTRTRNPTESTEVTREQVQKPQKVVVTYGTLSVNVVGTWGNLVIDGKPSGTTPLKIKLKSGRHTIRVYNEATGFDLTKKVTIRGGETENLAFEP
jgi:hypothetical protein